MNILKPYKIKLAPTLDGHWYDVSLKDRAVRGGPFPSSTTILNAYPQSAHLTRWIADHGWSESRRILSAAGERGTIVHNTIEALLDGILVGRDEHAPGFNRSFTLEEWHKISTFVDWYKEFMPERVAVEMPVFSKKYKYAGRIDYILKINNEYGLIDFKTSSGIHNHFPLQFSSYAQAVEEMTDIKISFTAALQLGAKNKNGYRYVLYPEWREHLKVFLAVKKTWEYEYARMVANPPVLRLPDSLKLPAKSDKINK